MHAGVRNTSMFRKNKKTILETERSFSLNIRRCTRNSKSIFSVGLLNFNEYYSIFIVLHARVFGWSTILKCFAALFILLAHWKHPRVSIIFSYLVGLLDRVLINILVAVAVALAPKPLKVYLKTRIQTVAANSYSRLTGSTCSRYSIWCREHYTRVTNKPVYLLTISMRGHSTASIRQNPRHMYIMYSVVASTIYSKDSNSSVPPFEFFCYLVIIVIAWK